MAEGLRRQALSGTRWTALAAAVGNVLQLIQVAVLARLLDPVDFGLMALVMVVLAFVQSYADLGLSQALIARGSVAPRRFAAFYWLNVISGCGLFTAVCVFSPVLAHLLGNPALTPLLPWAGASLLILPLGQGFQTLLQKELHFKPIAMAEMAGSLAGVSVAIATAAAGAGVYALIWGQLANAMVRTVPIAVRGWQDHAPLSRFSWRDLHGDLRFGVFQMGERTLALINTRIDQLLVGALLGVEALGYYHLAWQMTLQPLARLNPVVMRVAFPLFARIQGDRRRLQRGYFQAQRLLGAVNFPLFIALAILAPVFVPAVFGERWTPSVGLVQLLAGVAVFRTIGNPAGALLLSQGRAGRGFSANLAITLLQLPAIALGASLGAAMGVAAALLALQSAFFAVAYAALIRPVLGPCAVGYFVNLGRPLSAATIMAAIMALLPLPAGWSPFAVMGVSMVLGGLVYLLAGRAFLPEEWKLGKQWLGRRDHAQQI
ncbi:MAG: MOP flippase family protein [Pseudomonadota bacterium]|nr:MOP flippase family protein [Pseudomonadota bacterium]